MKSKEAIQYLQSEFGDQKILDKKFPKPYCRSNNSVRAIYLGCDPSNKHSTALPYAFALESGECKFKGFITSHRNNLNAIGLSWDSVYVQNLCQNYFSNETSKNLRIWKQAAKRYWIQHLKEELDKNFNSRIPVLLTSQYLLEVLGNDSWKNVKAPEFYECRVSIPVPATENKLGRPLIPVYRGKSRKYDVSYHLVNEKWKKYRSNIMHFFSFTLSD